MQGKDSLKYNGFTSKNGNYIWSCALGLAWNELVSQHVKEPIKIIQNQQSAQKIVEGFNQSKFSTEDVDSKAYYIKSGYGLQIITTINKECKAKFPNKSFSDLSLKPGPQDITAYAYLFKELLYKIPFVRNQEKTFKFEGKQAESFKALQKDQKQQISYSYYQNQDKFMIYITGADYKDTIYLIKDKSIQTVQQAVNIVTENQGKSYKKLSKIDQFQMPIVDLDLRHSVEQLVGKSIANQNLNGYTFSFVEEALKLKIDENGAKVQSQGIIAMVGCCMQAQEPKPKSFILDKEFWIVMKEYAKHPYLVAQIKNPIDNKN